MQAVEQVIAYVNSDIEPPGREDIQSETEKLKDQYVIT